MKIRYLASIEGVFCAVAIRDVLGNFIANTQLIPERNIYAAVLNREQWDKIRAEYWGGLTLCEHGKLVPDVDFVASDGRVFLDMGQCLEHEGALRLPSWKRALDSRPFMSRQDIGGKFLQLGVMRICIDTMPEHLTAEIIGSMSQICGYQTEDFCFYLSVLGVHPEFELVRVDPDTQPIEYEAHLHTNGTIQISRCGVKSPAVATNEEKQALAQMVATRSPGVPACYQRTEADLNNYVRHVIEKSQESSSRAEFIASGLCADVVQYNNGEFCNAATEFRYKQWLHETGKVSDPVVPTPTPDTPAVEPPKSLADKLFLACSENWTSVHFLASLLKETEAAILAEAEKDARLKLSATRKSICKL